MRTPVTVKIKFKSPSLDDFIERYAVDVSKAGIFIRTPKPLSVGTALNFEFQLQDGSPLLSGSGTVVWVRDQNDKQGASPGMGVRFDELPPASRDVLTRVLAQKTDAAQFGGAVAAPAALAPAEPAAPASPEAVPEPVVLPEPKAPAPEKPAAEKLPVAAAEEEEEAPAPPPKKKPAQRESTAETKRKESLGEVLFEEEDTKSAVADGAAPLEPEPPRRNTPTPQPVVPTSAKPVTATEERKSSPVGWVIILLIILGAGGWYWWKYYGPGKQQVTPPPAADVGVVSKPDLAPAPPAKPKVAMQVESTPAGAKILVDGQDTGKVTPAEIPDLDPEAEVEITLDLAGKKLHRAKVKPSAETPLKVELAEPAARKIRITSEPPGATIYFDGDKVGTTPFDVTKALKPARSYPVKLKLDGYAAFETKVKPADLTWARDGDDEVGTIAATLEKKAEPATTKRKRPRARKGKTPDGDDTGGDDTATPEPEPEPEPEKPAPAPAAEPEKPAPGTPPATKGGIKKPSWSN